ncbi:hypothetical protein PP175_26810 (plasmid) [Aneurinibacillus sp. Ricciae_BoGa-3]|nr:hypothetical protein [Aneurinibacillus sp. Ricciae_BoGa-3]WCK57649.1 hypothetical protein PP175_26810 [Aneurinibacillus sp. Ricciae_BoGa-3]
MGIDVETLASVMEHIRESNYAKSKQVKQFVEDVLEHFGEKRQGS